MFKCTYTPIHHTQAPTLPQTIIYYNYYIVLYYTTVLHYYTTYIFFWQSSNHHIQMCQCGKPHLEKCTGFSGRLFRGLKAGYYVFVKFLKINSSPIWFAAQHLFIIPSPQYNSHFSHFSFWCSLQLWWYWTEKLWQNHSILYKYHWKNHWHHVSMNMYNHQPTTNLLQDLAVQRAQK